MAYRNSTLLKELPYSNLNNFQLKLCLDTTKIKFNDLITQNPLHKTLIQATTYEAFETISCKYYEQDKFINMTKETPIQMSILHINLQSSFKNLALLKANLIILGLDFDIIVVSEIGNHPKMKLYNVMKDNYDIEYAPPDSCKGGLAVFINKKNKYNVMDEMKIIIPEKIEDIWIQVYINNTIYYIGAIYRHPNQKTEQFTDKLNESINKLIKKNKNIIIVGDINISLLKTDPKSKAYLDTLLNNSMIPAINLPTRITDYSMSLIDHINVYRTQSSLKNKIISGNILLDISDHLPNFMIIEGKPKLNNKERPKIRIFSERNKAKFLDELKNSNWEVVYANDNANEAYDLFIKKFKKIYNKCFPLVKISRSKFKDKPWITKGLKISTRHKNNLYVKQLSNPDDYKLKYQTYKNKLSKALDIAEKNYYSNKLTQDQNKLSQIWNVYNELLNKEKTKEPPKIAKLIIDNHEITKDKDISNALNNYFATIGKTLAETFPKNTNFKVYLNNPNLNSFYQTEISEEEITKEIEQINVKKSPGMDDIKPMAVKLAIPYISKPLSHIYNLSFLTGQVPDQLKIAKIIPIFKKKEKYLPVNYRPISLLSIFEKIMEKLMYKRIYAFLTKFKIIIKIQFGFRNNHSTNLAVTEIVTSIKELINDKNNVLGIYCDLSKAFDTVDHDILLYKLNHYGIRGNTLKWFKSYLSNRKQSTYINQTYSDVLENNIGVPQGSVLGPLLFLIYINDIINITPHEDPNINIRLFADDTNIFISDKSIDNVYNIAQTTINKLYSWFSNNKLTLNTDKTFYSLFTNKNVTNPKKLFIENKEIKKVQSAKYLGIYLDDKMNWNDHTNKLKCKLMQLNSALHYLSRFINDDHARRIYYAYVYPHIIYGIENYGLTSKNNMKKIQISQNKIIKTLFKKDNRYNTDDLFKETKLMNVVNVCKLQQCCFVYKQKNQILPNIFNNYYITNIQVRQQSTRQNSNIYIPNIYLSEKAQRNIKYSGAILWNELPQNIQQSNTIHTFKKQLNKHLLNTQNSTT